MLGHTFVQLADNIMVGQLGTAELAAASLGNKTWKNNLERFNITPKNNSSLI